MTGHEKRDISFSIVLRAVIALVVIGAVIDVGVWWLYRYLRTADMQRDVSPTLVGAAPPSPPEPRLQIDPQQDLQKYLRGQQEILQSYGWQSRDEGRVRIPIDRAMQLVVEREKR